MSSQHNKYDEFRQWKGFRFILTSPWPASIVIAAAAAPTTATTPPFAANSAATPTAFLWSVLRKLFTQQLSQFLLESRIEQWQQN